MRHVVRFVGWSSGEPLLEVQTEGAPYVPQLKSVMAIRGVRYLVAAVESECDDGRWRVLVKLARA